MYELDGISQWSSLTTPGASPARGINASGIGIVHEIGGDNHFRQESYFEDRYKLIRYYPTIYDEGEYVCVPNDCALGWNPLPGLPGNQSVPTPPNPVENDTNGTNALVTGGTWLFDVVNDPLEKEDLSQVLPEVVERMVETLAKLSQRPGTSWDEQKICPGDPASNPGKYFDGVWTPWRGSREPTCNAGGSNEICLPQTTPQVEYLNMYTDID